VQAILLFDLEGGQENRNSLNMAGKGKPPTLLEGRERVQEAVETPPNNPEDFRGE